jgi:hypothetical protein
MTGEAAMIVVFKNILGEIPVHPDSQAELRKQFNSYLSNGMPNGCEAVIAGYGHFKSAVKAYINFTSIAFIIDSSGQLSNSASISSGK